MDIRGGIGAHACLKHCFQDIDNIPRIIFGKNKSRVVKTDIQLNSLDQTVAWLFFFHVKICGVLLASGQSLLFEGDQRFLGSCHEVVAPTASQPDCKTHWS